MSEGDATTTSDPEADRRAVRTASRLPSWMGSIRFRIAALYSVALFAVAAVIVSGIYVGQARALSDEEIYQRVTIVQAVPGGVIVQDALVRDKYREIEQLANEQALENLRQYSFSALAVLFLLSLGIGWVIAGRVLRPIGRITEVAKDITATDLSRRIHLHGPDDELRELADTFDDMLGRLDVAFASQREFIHEASHELRNPLAVIRANLDVTLADPDATDADYRETLEVVQRSGERMSRLVDDLLVYARQGTLSLQHETVDVRALINESAAEFRATGAAHQVAVVGEGGDGLQVDGDRLALRQALANLLANALRVAPPESTVRVRAGSEGGWVWIAVEDEGPGIDPEDQEKVFQRFWRATGESTGARRSGLGLTIVRQIAEAHGGQVRVASEVGRGAAFALWIPAGTPRAPTPPPPPRRPTS